MSVPMHPIWLNASLIKLALAQSSQGLAGVMFSMGIVFTTTQNNDGRGLAITLLTRTLPTLVCAFIGGVLADRFSKKRISLMASAVSVITYIGFAVLTWEYGFSWQVQLFSLLTAFISALGAPAVYSLLPAVVDHDYLVQANGFVRTFRNISYVSAPVLAGLLAAHYPAHILFVVASVFGTTNIILLALIHLPPTFNTSKDKNHEESLIESMKTAPHIFAHYRWLLLGVIFWSITLALDSGAGDVILPLYAIPLSSKITWSYVSAALSIGYITGSALSLFVKNSRYLIRLSFIFTALAAIRLCTIALTNNTWLWIASAFIAGIGFELGGVTWGSALQQRSPEKYLGRISSLDYAVSFGFIPFAYAGYALIPQQYYSSSLILTTAIIGAMALVFSLLMIRLEKTL
ncbi:MFS transporter [Alloscardovia omnicolens]|uniref:MFS transporter n=1 Tax=Alloscardovia omnicolens TaxID=419015 RepID=UPI003A6292D2